MRGGVMRQIGFHHTDVLEYRLGPVKAVSGRFVRLVLPGDNPDVASLVLEHESGALSTLNASYASASEYYLLNIYRSEEHTSELQSQSNLVCRLLLEKKKKMY